MNLVSTDNRRDLYELGSGGNWKVCKYIVIKEFSCIGQHYHKLKTELFAFIKGKGKIIVGDSVMDIEAPYTIVIVPGTYHSFYMEAGSEIICLASEVHDPSDDHKI
jgi:mannose-6-phosphate isomerase-like protein (cupin superfamily)